MVGGLLRATARQRRAALKGIGAGGVARRFSACRMVGGADSFATGLLLRGLKLAKTGVIQVNQTAE
jgi:hypothetical protein